MRSLNELQQPNWVYQMYKNTEPLSTTDLTKRAVCILDTKYEKADLPKVVDSCDHLSSTKKESLLQLLKKLEELFYGNLGNWKPYQFNLS